MSRPRCPRCKGYLQKCLEWHHTKLEVVRCLHCGWRHYPAQGGIEDADGYLDLLLEVFAPGGHYLD